MFLLDGLIKDLTFIRKIYGDTACVKSIADPMIHLLASPLLDSQTASATANIIFDTKRPSIIEVRSAIRGTSNEEMMIFVCDLPPPVIAFRDSGLEDANEARKEAMSMTYQRILAFVKNRASFLDKFPLEYGKISKALLQARIRLSSGELLNLVLGLVDQVIEFEFEEN